MAIRFLQGDVKRQLDIYCLQFTKKSRGEVYISNIFEAWHLTRSLREKM